MTLLPKPAGYPGCGGVQHRGRILPVVPAGCPGTAPVPVPLPLEEPLRLLADPTGAPTKPIQPSRSRLATPRGPPQHLQSWGSVGGTRLTATYCPLSLGWGLRGHGHGTASPQGDSRASGRGHWGDFGGGHSTGTGVSSFPAVPGALWLRPPGVSPRLHFPGVVSGGYWLQSHLSGCPRIFSSRYMSLIQAG